MKVFPTSIHFNRLPCLPITLIWFWFTVHNALDWPFHLIAVLFPSLSSSVIFQHPAHCITVLSYLKSFILNLVKTSPALTSTKGLSLTLNLHTFYNLLHLHNKADILLRKREVNMIKLACPNTDSTLIISSFFECISRLSNNKLYLLNVPVQLQLGQCLIGWWYDTEERILCSLCT